MSVQHICHLIIRLAFCDCLNHFPCQLFGRNKYHFWNLLNAHQVWWVDIGFETDVTVVVLGVIDRFALLKIRVEPAKLVKRIDVVFFIDSNLSH